MMGCFETRPIRGPAIERRQRSSGESRRCLRFLLGHCREREFDGGAKVLHRRPVPRLHRKTLQDRDQVTSEIVCDWLGQPT